MTEVSREMLAAYVAWEPPCEVDVTKPARALGLIRAAFFAGWSAASVDGRRMAETGTGSGRSPTSAVDESRDAQTTTQSPSYSKYRGSVDQ